MRDRPKVPIVGGRDYFRHRRRGRVALARERIKGAGTAGVGVVEGVSRRVLDHAGATMRRHPGRRRADRALIVRVPQIVPAGAA